MKKFLESRVFLVIVCAIVFTSIGVFANNLLASEIDYNDTTVDQALDTLYTKTKPDYTGETTFTPSSETQTIQTQNKILRNNITIEAVPSTYKNLITLTNELTANDLVSGKQAYNSNGEVITGSLNSNCVSGVITCNQDCAGSTGIKIVNFNPSFYATRYINNSTNVYDWNIYDSIYSQTKVYNVNAKRTNQVTEFTASGNGYKYEDGWFKFADWGNDYIGAQVYYFICR